MKHVKMELPLIYGGQILPLIFQWIEPAVFTMGRIDFDDGYDKEDGPPFNVSFSSGFWMTKYPITQLQWTAITGDNPSAYKHENSSAPVENISWDMAVNYSLILNEKFLDIMPAGFKARLPTEAEWEYCCKTSQLFKYSSGNTLSDLNNAAWHKGNTDTKMPVGQKTANSLGLNDMIGNVFEWCLDTAGYYPESPQVNYYYYNDGDLKIIRGGGFNTFPHDLSLNCGGRGYAPANTTSPWIGFRMVLSMLYV